MPDYPGAHNQQRPHRSLALAVPEPEAQKPSSSHVNPRKVRRRDVLGGLIHEYHEVAAQGVMNQDFRAPQAPAAPAGESGRGPGLLLVLCQLFRALAHQEDWVDVLGAGLQP